MPDNAVGNAAVTLAVECLCEGWKDAETEAMEDEATDRRLTGVLSSRPPNNRSRMMVVDPLMTTPATTDRGVFDC